MLYSKLSKNQTTHVARVHFVLFCSLASWRRFNGFATWSSGGDGQRRTLEAVKLVPVKMEMETLKCKLAMSSANGSTHASSQKENGKAESQRDHRSMGNELSAIVQEKRQGKLVEHEKHAPKQFPMRQMGKLTRSQQPECACKICMGIYSI